ncbi:MAG TPA: YsnF/AvaK domain-containing protein [Candidatus Limnocylindrales bacterium]|nr:YsnF/AvaK domain-containing protein [Candidatus Limnocylindrales bacterium]
MKNMNERKTNGHPDGMPGNGRPTAAQGQGKGRDHTLRLHEEELVANKQWREIGEVIVRTETSEVPERLEVEADREEIEIEHVPVGEVVQERAGPREEEDGTLMIPVYEEQLVVQKRLYLREYLRIRKMVATETRAFNDNVRRERAIVEAPDTREVVRERYPESPR